MTDRGPATTGVAARLRILSERLAILGMLVLAAVAVYSTVDVALRYAFNAPLPGAVDVVSYGLAAALGCILPYGTAASKHVNVVIVTDMLPRRVQRGAATLVLMLNAGFFCLFGYGIARLTLQKHASGEEMWILGWPVWPAWSVVSAGILLTALVAVILTGAALGPARAKGSGGDVGRD